MTVTNELIKQWAVYEEKSGSRTIRTVFKIT